jgi:hypothetical protein
MAKIKQLFRGAFNLNRMPRIEYAYAFTEMQAWAIMCRRLAKRDGVHPFAVMGIFDGKRDNYKITVEMEVKEIETNMDETNQALL